MEQIQKIQSTDLFNIFLVVSSEHDKQDEVQENNSTNSQEHVDVL